MRSHAALLAPLIILAQMLAAPAAAALPRAANVPGGVALVALGPLAPGIPQPHAWLGEQAVLVAADHGQWVAVVGLALDTPIATHELRVVEASGEARSVHFPVVGKRYPEQRITLKDTRKVDLSASDLARVEGEMKTIQALKQHWRATPETDTDFVLPAEGRLTGRFGVRRYFNGEARSPHAGFDIAVPTGSPVKANARGTVLAIGDFFFNGKTVLVDHGNGLLSMYCHLDRIDVAPGDPVEKNQVVARSGMTGRATGPHLHWSVILNGAMVDPWLFVSPNVRKP